MTTKARKMAKPAAEAVATIPDPPDKAKADSLADLSLTPGLNAAAVVGVYLEKTFGELDVGSLARSLSVDMKGVLAGDLKLAEAMLYGQAHALQSIFVNLARRAISQEYLKQWEAYMRMALKAQNQCRMTLETLATIKNPPVVFARQANINNGGQQQVNNGAAADPARAQMAQAGAHVAEQVGDKKSAGIGKQAGARVAYQYAQASAHAANLESGKTELLEADDGERLDTRTAGTAGRDDPHLAPVGEIDRAANTRGQSKDRQ